MAQIAAHHESSSFNDHLTTNHECKRHSRGEEKKLTTSSRFFQCECISQSQAAFNERTECHFDAVAALVFRLSAPLSFNCRVAK